MKGGVKVNVRNRVKRRCPTFPRSTNTVSQRDPRLHPEEEGGSLRVHQTPTSAKTVRMTVTEVERVFGLPPIETMSPEVTEVQRYDQLASTSQRFLLHQKLLLETE